MASQTQIDHLRQLILSGAKTTVLPSGQRIDLQDLHALKQLLSEQEQQDLTARINNTARPDFFIDTYMPWD